MKIEGLLEGIMEDAQWVRKDQPHPFPDRFKNITRLNRNKDDKEGATLVATVENGNVLLDFGQNVECLGLTINDSKALIVTLIEAMTVAGLSKTVTKEQAN